MCSFLNLPLVLRLFVTVPSVKNNTFAKFSRKDFLSITLSYFSFISFTINSFKYYFSKVIIIILIYNKKNK